MILLSLIGLQFSLSASANLIDHVSWHGGVDLPRQFDEPGWKTIFSGHPGQIEGVDRNAVAAKSRPWIECLKAEWLALRLPRSHPKH